MRKTNCADVAAQPSRDKQGDGGDEARRFARKRLYVPYQIMSIHFYCGQRRRGCKYGIQQKHLTGLNALSGVSQRSKAAPAAGAAAGIPVPTARKNPGGRSCAGVKERGVCASIRVTSGDSAASAGHSSDCRASGPAACRRAADGRPCRPCRAVPCRHC